MIVKKVQNEQNQNTLLIVNDNSGNADSIIESLYTLLQDLVIYHQTGQTSLELDTEDPLVRYGLKNE